MCTSAIRHRSPAIGGVRIFYRDAGPRDAPVQLLLHGFPASSHQYVRLMDRLCDRFRVIAPDYPGFGYTDAPAPSPTGGSFVYSFESLATVIETFCSQLHLDRYFLYMFDFGGPIGLRLLERQSERIAGLIAQNANAYIEGLSAKASELVKLKADQPGATVWGRNDPLFPEPGARAYLRDLPEAELHLFDTGHFALEEHVDEISALIGTFIARSTTR